MENNKTINYAFIASFALTGLIAIGGLSMYHGFSQEILELQEQNDILEQKVGDLETVNAELAETNADYERRIAYCGETADMAALHNSQQEIQIEMLWDAIVTGEIPTYYMEEEQYGKV